MTAPARTANPWTLPDARVVLPADAPRERWLAERRTGIGSSDVALLMGVAEGGSEYELWLSKTRGQDAERTEAMRRGTWLEPHVVDFFAERVGLGVRRCGLIRHRAFDLAIATPDRLTADGGLLEVKCVAVDTPILTTSGWVSMGDLVVGEEVFSPDGHPVRIAGTSQVITGKNCYRVVTADGRSLVVDAGHLWTVQDMHRNHRLGDSAPWETVTTQELLHRDARRDGRSRGGGMRFRLPRQQALISKPVDLPLDPYLLGVWLGDGTSLHGGVTVGTADLDEMRILLEQATGVRLPEPRPTRTVWTLRPQLAPDEHHIPSAPDFTPERLQLAHWAVANGYGHNQTALALGIGRDVLTRAFARLTGEAESRAPTFASRLRELGVLGNKHVPETYLLAGTEQRLALLQGLLDSDGGISTRGQVVFCSTIEQLSGAVLYLARSLGWNATIRPYDRGTKPYWLVRFTPTMEDLPPFRLTRKLRRVLPSVTQSRHPRIVAIEPVPSRPVRCIRVDSPDGLFLAGCNLMPTHNTIGTHAKVGAQWRSGGIATHAYVQGQWQLAVSGRSHVWFAAYTLDQEPQIRGPVERDEPLIARIRQRAARWWSDHIVIGTPPPPDLSTITDEEIALRWPDAERGSVVEAQWPAHVRALLIERAECHEQLTGAEKRKKEIDQALKVMAGSAEALLLGDRPVVTLKPQKNNPSVDPALPVDHPEIDAKYIRRGSSRRIHICKGWGEA